jgi:hypothetical protein
MLKGQYNMPCVLYMPYNAVHSVFQRHHTRDRHYDNDDVASAHPNGPKSLFVVFGLSRFAISWPTVSVPLVGSSSLLFPSPTSDPSSRSPPRPNS